MIKLFSLEMKNDDPLALASKVRSIMHDIDSTSVKIDISLIAYVKELYPTYSHYLESLQASGNLEHITFEALEKNFAEREKDFRKMTVPSSSEEAACFSHREKSHAPDSSRGRGGKIGRGRRKFRERGCRQFDKSDLHCTCCNKDGHDASKCRTPWDNEIDTYIFVNVHLGFCRPA